MLLACGLFMTTLFSCTPERITEEFDEQQVCCDKDNTSEVPLPPPPPKEVEENS